jgi:hypothetical protein
MAERITPKINISAEELIAGIRKIRHEQLKLINDSKKIVSLRKTTKSQSRDP